MNHYFADLHIHVGRDMFDKPVKITASKTLTLTNILREASRRKGIELIGVIDCHAPAVQEELRHLLEENKAKELGEGGIQFERVTLIPGAEIEIYDENCQGPIHVLCYFPTLTEMRAFSNWLSHRVTNITLSSQRYYGSAKELQLKVKEHQGLFILAHVFTPFKSAYGKGVKHSLEEVFNLTKIDAIEVGLSADIGMADQIEELHMYTYVTNSDAHSLQKIGREYQEIRMEHPSFKEFSLALNNEQGRRIMRHFGLHPLLGKYYNSVCSACGEKIEKTEEECPNCQHNKTIKGVQDRIDELGNSPGRLEERPAYMYQVPLEYLPGIGAKTIERLLAHFQTEMNVIHHASFTDLQEVLRPDLAKMIMQMRKGELTIDAGGGGIYGKVHRKGL